MIAIILKSKDQIVDFIKAIINILYRNRDIVNKNACFLEDGDYKNLNKGDIICNTNKETLGNIKTFNGIDSNKSLLPYILKHIKDKIKYHVTSIDEKRFSATHIIICSSGKELKLIDYKTNEILTTYSDEIRKSKYIANKQIFSEYFPTPKLLLICDNFIIEKFIRSQNFKISEALNYLFPKYLTYFETVKTRAVVNIESDRRMAAFFQQVFGKEAMIEAIVGLPKVLVHGDLWSANILCENKTYYVTDFEAVSTKFFLYDIIYLMFMEYAFYNDDSLIKDYLKGHYDKMICRISTLFGIEYNKKYREIYLKAFIIQVLFEKWQRHRIMKNKISYILNLCKQYSC